MNFKTIILSSLTLISLSGCLEVSSDGGVGARQPNPDLNGLHVIYGPMYNSFTDSLLGVATTVEGAARGYRSYYYPYQVVRGCVNGNGEQVDRVFCEENQSLIKAIPPVNMAAFCKGAAAQQEYSILTRNDPATGQGEKAKANFWKLVPLELYSTLAEHPEYLNIPNTIFSRTSGGVTTSASRRYTTPGLNPTDIVLRAIMDPANPVIFNTRYNPENDTNYETDNSSNYISGIRSTPILNEQDMSTAMSSSNAVTGMLGYSGPFGGVTQASQEYRLMFRDPTLRPVSGSFKKYAVSLMLQQGSSGGAATVAAVTSAQSDYQNMPMSMIWDIDSPELQPSSGTVYSAGIGSKYTIIPNANNGNRSLGYEFFRYQTFNGLNNPSLGMNPATFTIGECDAMLVKTDSGKMGVVMHIHHNN